MTKSVKKVLISLLSVALVFTIYCGLYKVSTKGYADSGEITMTKAASARIVPDAEDGLTNSGLKFEAQLEKATYDNLVSTYENVEAGIIIVPEDYVEAAGGYTLDKLGGLAALNGKTYYKITESFKENETHYLFYNSIITIKPANYNRDFTAAAFIKITETDATKIATLSDYVLYEGAYYLYSDSHTANVYDVAYAAYEDRVTEETDGYFEIDDGSGLYGKQDSEGYEILQKYLDSVAVVNGANGEVTVANNGVYYKSPFKIGKSIEGYSFIQQGPTAVTYNGEREKNLFKVDETNKVKVYSDAVSSGATFNADGTVTLKGVIPTSWGATTVGNTNNSYIAFAGDYGVGTYIDFTFKGNNLPQVCMFANEITAQMGGGVNHNDYTGYLLMNGIYAGDVAGGYIMFLGKDRLCCFGPYKYNVDAQLYKDINTTNACSISASENSLLSQDKLIADTSEHTYKYTVGSYEGSDGIVVLDITLYDYTLGKSVISVTRSTDKTVEEIQKVGGNIIVYGCCKEDATSGTTFSYSAPYQSQKENLISSDAHFNRDGSVTLVSNPSASSGVSTVSTTDNAYIAFNGDYGVGTYIDFTFTGNNLPYVSLFTTDITAKLGGGSSYENYNGYVLMNGLYRYSPNNVGTQYPYQEDLWMDYLVCFGPDRYCATAQYFGDRTVCLDPYIISSANLFTQNKLKVDTSGDEYRYTVGSYVSDGVVMIEAILHNITDDTHIATGTYNTGKTQTEVEALGKKIIAYACSTETFREGTTFNYSNPYYLYKDNMVTSGATFNTDGSVSLDNKYPTAGIGFVGSVQKVDNSYIAFKGNYGVGTYIDFTFTGNNLPYVTLFTNNITGDITGGGSTNSDKPINSGYILMNGMYFEKDGNAVTTHDWANKYLACMGPDKYGIDYGDGTNIDINNNYNINEAWLVNNLKISSDKYFTQYYLRTDTSGIVYKYTVGSYVENDVVYIDVAIVNAKTGDELGSGKFNTGKTQTEVEALGGNIIAYGCFKGGTDATTFKYSKPYTK